jgi:hypothetical protein
MFAFKIPATPAGFMSVQVNDNLCYYVSTTTLWPFPNGTKGDNQAKLTCTALGFDLATVQNGDELTALWNFIGRN